MSCNLSGDAGGFERRHLAHEIDRRFDEADRETGAGPLPQAHAEIEQRIEAAVKLTREMATFESAGVAGKIS